MQPYCDVKASFNATTTCKLVVTDPLESLSIRLKLSMYLGFLFASPVVLWQLWRFITPGLYDREKRYAVPFVTSSIMLFVAGAALAIVTFPKTLDFFAAFGGSNLELLYTPGKYLGLLVLMMLMFGLGFEFPVVLCFLMVAGVLRWQQLAAVRRYAIVWDLQRCCQLLPSSPSGRSRITLLALSIPMCIFYEVSIQIGRFFIQRRPEPTTSP